MKKLIKLALVCGGVVAIVKYMDKSGLPYSPVKLPVDPYDVMLKGIHFAENKGISI